MGKPPVDDFLGVSLTMFPPDFAFSLGAHRGSLTDRATVNEKRTNGKPLGIGAEPDKATRRFARRDGQPLSMSI